MQTYDQYFDILDQEKNSRGGLFFTKSRPQNRDKKMILDRAHTLLKDDRQDLRIKENARIPWRIKYKQREGVAKLKNISISGMLVETDSSFNPKDECVFSFDSDPQAGIYIPQLGRLVWHKKKRFSRNKYISGIKFMEADTKILQQMRSRVQMGVDLFVKKRKMTTFAGYCLCAVIVSSIGALLWYSNGIYEDVTAANYQMQGVSSQQNALSDSYFNLWRMNAIDLQNANEKLNIANQLLEEDKAAIALFTQELEATKALLGQTETMLIQANDRNAEITSQLSLLQAEGGVITSEQVRIAEENIMTIADAQSLMSTYQAKIKSVKGEIKRIKGENHVARQSAIAQIDDQKLELGNNGYVIRDGQVISVDEAQYSQLTVGSPGSWETNSSVAIDVTFLSK